MAVSSKYHPCSKEFQEDAKRFGLTGNQLIQRYIREGKLSSPTRIKRQEIEHWAKSKGFKDYNEYEREIGSIYRWNKGTGSPMSENVDCAQYLGIYIVERIVPKLFQDPIRMPNGNYGYDWICKKGFKIDYKSSCIIFDNKGWSGWNFSIRYNNIADYFILVAFDNRSDLNPLHIWLISKNEIMRGKKFYKRDNFSVTNKYRNLLPLKRYEVVDKLKKMIDCCDKLKE